MREQRYFTEKASPIRPNKTSLFR